MSTKNGMGIGWRHLKRWALAGEKVMSARRADEIRIAAERDGKHWLVPQCRVVAEELRAVGQY